MPTMLNADAGLSDCGTLVVKSLKLGADERSSESEASTEASQMLGTDKLSDNGA